MLVVPTSQLATPAFLLDLTARQLDGTVAANRYIMSATADLAPLLDLHPARLEVGWEKDAVRLRHLGRPAALGVIVEDGRPPGGPGWAVFGDNVIDLLPGEACLLTVESRGVAIQALPLLVTAWDLAPLVVFPKGPGREAEGGG